MNNKSHNTPASILLVDDDAIILNTLTCGLTGLGYKTTACEKPRDAVEQFKRNTPDLVITDYRMPEMDGLALARTLMEFEHRPVIMLSAYNETHLVREAIGAGVSTYLIKPVSAESIAPSIEATLARFAEIKALIQQGSNIQAGLENQRLISTAVGIVMARTNRSQDLAFESLRRMSRNQRRPLREIAFDLVDSISSANATLTELQKIDDT